MMRTMLAVLALLLLAAACGTESDEAEPRGDGHGSPSEPADEPLAGTTWTLVSYSTGSDSTPVPKGTTASLALSDKGVEVDTGCNSGGGEVVVGDDTIRFKRMMTTLRGCVDPGPKKTEEAFTDVVHGKVHYVIDGDRLTLDRHGRTLEFTAS